MADQVEFDNRPNVICLNDAVILHSNRRGIVRYISDKSSDRIAVGIELMEPNATSFSDVDKLFKCKPKHGILIPLAQISRKIMPEELLSQLQFLTNKVNKYHKQIEELREKLVQNENQYASWITNQFLSSNKSARHRSQKREYVSQRSGTADNDVDDEYRSTSRKPYIVNEPAHRDHRDRRPRAQHSDRHAHRREHAREELSHTQYSHRSAPQHMHEYARAHRVHNVNYVANVNTEHSKHGNDHHQMSSMSLNLQNTHRLHGVPMRHAVTTNAPNGLEYDEKEKQLELSMSNNSMHRDRKKKVKQQPVPQNSVITSPSKQSVSTIGSLSNRQAKQRKDKHRRRSATNYLMSDTTFTTMTTQTTHTSTNRSARSHSSSDVNEKELIQISQLQMNENNPAQLSRSKEKSNRNNNNGKNGSRDAMVTVNEYEEV